VSARRTARASGSSILAVEETQMYQEAQSASDAVRAQLADDDKMSALGALIRHLAPRMVITCARGSSDHAATYAKYLIETRAHVVTASAAPSVSSVYGINQNLRDCLFIAISQSGRSPDLLASVSAAKASGATVLALCNSAASPLAAAADYVLTLHAEPETSIAATKSYLATLAALMDRAWRLDWTSATALLETAEHLYVVGRGLGLGAAQEIALKCKETCGLHAEAFSSAELRHGPFTLLGPRFPALLLAQNDAAGAGISVLAAELAKRGVPLLLAGATATGVAPLPTLACAAALQPILLVQSAYRMISTLAVRRGFDPDRPANLTKVTETV
jgi:glucosamine--fructose-6-phosphate aminotransferase (isomerizing)